MSPIPGGSMTALATPFRHGTVDPHAFSRMCERQVRRGTSALIVCGSTGEAPALRPAEQEQLFRLAVAAADGRIPVIAGCGGPSTDAAAGIAALAAQCGVTALLCAPTPYVKPSQDGIMAHMRMLVRLSGLPLILYDVPSRAGVALQDATIARLAESGVAVGLKDATADLGRPSRLRRLCGDDLVQLSGDDATAAAYRAAGGHGCISVTANVTPSLCALLHHSWQIGDLATFAHVRDLLAPLHDALFLETNPVPLKAALALLHLAEAEVRLPLLQARTATEAALGNILAGLARLEDAAALEPHHAAA